MWGREIERDRERNAPVIPYMYNIYVYTTIFCIGYALPLEREGEQGHIQETQDPKTGYRTGPTKVRL